MLMLKRKSIPHITINRLSIYYRYLEKIVEAENKKDYYIISSSKIAEVTGINSSQIRKDLAYFGQFGKRGMGYCIKNLRIELGKILGLDKRWSVIIAGAGNLGQALVNYRGFKKRGFIIKGIFDNNLLNIGKKLDHLYIYDIEEMEKSIRKKNIMIGVLTVSANSAQEVANKMVKSGIRAILNFAPTHLILPPEIKLHNVDLSIEFEGLTYHLSM